MLGLENVKVLLCDADGNLFPSEEPAFVASCGVTNALMAAIGSDKRFDAEELRLATTGKNFRTTAIDLARDAGVALDPATLQEWVEEEQRQVTTYLARVLRPDPDVTGPLGRLARDYRLAAVSSSATPRLAACFSATGLDALLPPGVRFSAEDSLSTPTSKPDPAIYLHAAEQLGIDTDQAIAIEDSVPGAQSAVAAGFPTIGNIAFVPPSERADRTDVLEQAGVTAVVESWHEIEELLRAEPGGRAPESAAVERAGAA